MFALNLEWTIAFPHAAARRERLDHTLDEWPQVGIRRLLFSQGVEGAYLDHDSFVDRHGAQGLDVLVADGAVGPDPAQVIDDYRGVWKFLAYALQFGQTVRVDQAAHGQVVLGGGGKHARVPIRLQP